MKKNKPISIVVIALVCLWLMPFQSKVQAILLEDITFDVQETPMVRQAITNQPIELKGPVHEITFYYEIRYKTSEKDNQLVLELSNSELLIGPSALTIRVDEEAVLSKPLTGNQLPEKLIVPLKGKALEKGFHRVTVSFNGVIKEGVCVDQDTPGNWLTIGINSYFQLSGQQFDEQQLLTDYPNVFIGTEKRPVMIILPDDASMKTVNSGMKVAAYLAEQAKTEKTIKVVRESSIRKISGNVIFLGAQSEFSSLFMKNLFSQVTLPTDKESLVLSRQVLSDGKQRVDALFVVAQSPKELEKRVIILTTPQLTRQLAGQQMSIQNVPDGSRDKDNRIVPLSKFGIMNFTLDRYQRESQQYFYYAPIALQKGQSSILELHLKRSEMSSSVDIEKTMMDLVDTDIELVVLVNDVPHSVNIDRLTAAENGMYTVQIPIDASTIKENRMISLQFSTNGLLMKSPCFTTNQNRWIYITDDSFFTFPTENETATHSLAEFPSPFIDKENQTMIILPSIGSVDDNQLLNLYQSMYVSGLSSQWQLETAENLTADDVKNRHLIFVGGPAVQPLLQDKESDLTVPYSNGLANIMSFGFLQEAAEMVSWIQPSPWGGEHAMLVFDHTDSTKPYVDKVILDFLKSMDLTATVAVKSTNRQVYTNAIQLEEVFSEVKADQSSGSISTLSTWWIVGFVTLPLFAIVVMFFVLRKRRHREP